MSKETYSIPAGQTARYHFQRNVIEICTSNAEAWGISAERLAKMIPTRADYEQKYAIASNKSTQSPAATVARDAAWEIYKIQLVDLYNHDILNNDAIPTSEKDALYIHYTATGGGIPASAPISTPIITFAVGTMSVLKVIYADSAAPATHSKPDNVVFCELVYKVDAPAPGGPVECVERLYIPHSHETIVFTPDQRGKTIYAYARWVNRNGKVGPWSGVVTAIIP